MSQQSQKNQVIQKEYEVEYIFDRKIGKDDKLYYLIKWVGWPKSKATWEPLENLLGDQGVQNMVKKIDEQSQKSMKKKWGSLKSWNRQKENTTIDNNIDNSTNNVSFIDLQEPSCQLIHSKQKQNFNFMSKIRKKITIQDNQKYPFQEDPLLFKSQIRSVKKLKSIQKIQKIDGELKCFIYFTLKSLQPEWISLDIIRLLYPTVVLTYYQKQEQKFLNSKVNK